MARFLHFPPRTPPIWIQSESQLTALLKAVPLRRALLLGPFPLGNFLCLHTSNSTFPLQSFFLTAHWYSQSSLNLRQGCLPHEALSSLRVVQYLLDSGQCLEHNMFPVNLESVNEFSSCCVEGLWFSHHLQCLFYVISWFCHKYHAGKIPTTKLLWKICNWGSLPR